MNQKEMMLHRTITMKSDWEGTVYARLFRNTTAEQWGFADVPYPESAFSFSISITVGTATGSLQIGQEYFFYGPDKSNPGPPWRFELNGMTFLSDDLAALCGYAESINGQSHYAKFYWT